MTTKSILALPYDELAKALQGMEVTANGRKFLFEELEGFPPSHQEKGHFKPLSGAKAGAVYCCKMRAAVITSIKAGEGALYLKGLRTSHGVIPGANNCSAAFGITDHGVWGRLVERSGGFDLEMLDATTPPDAPPKVKSKKTKGSTLPDGASELEAKTIAIFMPQIIDAWLKRPVGITFEKFIDELNERCKTVTELQRMLAP